MEETVVIGTEQLEQIQGLDVVDGSGKKVGSVGQVYLDDESGQPEWVTVKTGMFGTGESFVPLSEASFDGGAVSVPFDKDKVKDAPRVDADEHLDPEQERELYRYYGRDYGTAAAAAGGRQTESGTGRAASGRTENAVDAERGGPGSDASGPNTDEAMTRSEERLEVGTESRESGRARLRKFVVTENVTQTVPVSHEEVRIEREPITDANRDEAMSGGEITEEEHEVTLHEERPVTRKETVPVERVRLDTETVTDQEQVSEQVRKEQIEADEDRGRDASVDRGRE
jgi:uncharacterized protein (TIGR02271 family)